MAEFQKVKWARLTHESTAAPEIFDLKHLERKKSQHEFYHIVTINSSFISTELQRGWPSFRHLATV